MIFCFLFCVSPVCDHVSRNTEPIIIYWFYIRLWYVFTSSLHLWGSLFPGDVSSYPRISVVLSPTKFIVSSMIFWFLFCVSPVCDHVSRNTEPIIIYWFYIRLWYVFTSSLHLWGSLFPGDVSSYLRISVVLSPTKFIVSSMIFWLLFCASPVCDHVSRNTEPIIIYWFYIHLWYVFTSSLRHRPLGQNQLSRIRSILAEPRLFTTHGWFCRTTTHAPHAIKKQGNY